MVRHNADESPSVTAAAAPVANDAEKAAGLAHPPLRFQSPLDLTVTPAVLVGLCLLATLLTGLMRPYLPAGFAVTVLLWYTSLVAVTLLFLKVLRQFFPYRPSKLTASRHKWELYRYNLLGFLMVTVLAPLHLTSVIPPPLRKYFLMLLGLRAGKGVINIAGIIAEPHSLVSIGEGAIIGLDAIVLPHAIAVFEEDVVFLGEVAIGRNAIIGARSLVLPDVTVGEGSMVTAMSLVARGTVIPPFEVWGGIPAVKIRDIPQPVRSPAATLSQDPDSCSNRTLP